MLAESDVIGQSDHFLVHAVFDICLQARLQDGLGSVKWDKDGSWAAGLEEVSEVLDDLSRAVEEVASDHSFLPALLGGAVSKVVRRKVLDAAAWCRNMVYTMVGHSMRAVRRTSPATAFPSRKCVKLPVARDHHMFKEVVQQTMWAQRRKTSERNMELCRSSPGQAAKILSSVFKAQAQFPVALVDPLSGKSQSSAEMIEQIQADLQNRAHSKLSSAPAEEGSYKRLASLVRNGGAAAGVLKDQGNNYQPCVVEVCDEEYTTAEVEAAMSSLKISKATINMCNAAAAILSPHTVKCTKALVNLSMRCGLTSTHWSLRQFTPLRKGGAKVVRTTEQLRPISLVPDMASIQDALWLDRNASKLTDYHGSDQQGAVGDAIAILVALVIHAQLRAYLGLDTCWAMGDLKWAFDLAE